MRVLVFVAMRARDVSNISEYKTLSMTGDQECLPSQDHFRNMGQMCGEVR